MTSGRSFRGKPRAGPAPGPERTEQLARRILTLLSFALRVEPRMIRAVRRMLPECRWDPGIESIVWQDEALSSRHCEAAAFDPEKVKELREQVMQVDPDQRRAVYELVRGCGRTRTRASGAPRCWDWSRRSQAAW